MIIRQAALAIRQLGLRIPSHSILWRRIATCLAFATILWQLVVPYLANTPCGLIIPHDHILIGRAVESDLEGHLEAEAACATGTPASQQEQAADLHGHHGHVVNVIRVDQNTTSSVISLFNVVAALLISLTFMPRRQFCRRLDPLQLLGVSVAIPPPKPPPLAA